MTLPEVNITEPFIMNVKGQTVNVLSLILARHEQNLTRAKKRGCAIAYVKLILF